MPKEAGRPGEKRNRLDDGGWEIEIKQDGRDRSGHVERQGLAPHLRDDRAETPQQVDMPTGHAALLGKRKNALTARVDRVMDRMSEARHLLMAGMELWCGVPDPPIAIL